MEDYKVAVMVNGRLMDVLFSRIYMRKLMPIFGSYFQGNAEISLSTAIDRQIKLVFAFPMMTMVEDMSGGCMGSVRNVQEQRGQR